MLGLWKTTGLFISRGSIGRATGLDCRRLNGSRLPAQNAATTSRSGALNHLSQATISELTNASVVKTSIGIWSDIRPTILGYSSRGTMTFESLQAQFADAMQRYGGRSTTNTNKSRLTRSPKARSDLRP